MRQDFGLNYDEFRFMLLLFKIFKALAFRTKKQDEQRVAFRPLHMLFFPLGNHVAGIEQVHHRLSECGDTTPMIGSGYRLNFEKHQFSITRPNEISSLLTQSMVSLICSVIERFVFFFLDHLFHHF